MQHEIKSFRAEIKARVEGDKGIVDAIVSVFNNVDLGGDRVMPGAFSKSISEWQTKGDPVPVIWSHEWDQPESHIGFVDPNDMKETEVGLQVKMRLDLDRPRAEQVFHLLKNRRVTQFSFGYFARGVKDGQDDNGNAIRELTDIELFEVGPTLLGMNPATQLLEAASFAMRASKEGRVLNAKNTDALKAARDLIDQVLITAEPVADEATKADEEAKTTDTEVVDTTEVPATVEVVGDAQGTINSMDERINELLIETR